MAQAKIRLDQLLVEKGLTHSRQRAKALIMAGQVRVDDLTRDKPGTLVSTLAKIDLTGQDMPYVSRGGLKLAKALDHFAISPQGWVCMDIGASTGGFTDCLLKSGAVRVIAVDVGYGQLAWTLRQDPRVVVMERTNIRHLPVDAVSEPMDLVTIDVSFISLKIVVPAALGFVKPGGVILALIKPQFEVGRDKVGKGGVVRDPTLHDAVIEDLSRFFDDHGLRCRGVVASPILGPKGNREFIIALGWDQGL
ncbi:MAG: TlyA family RNA methyltransferase [Desulfobacterales bacterium]|nr:TlyA family RNA methyltransferase [Desulfobacterales bacterium]